MRSLMRRTVVVTGAAAALLSPAVAVASASGASPPREGQSRTVSAGPAAAPAQAAGWTAVQSPSPGSQDNGLNGVAVVSATNAWAVGNYSNSTNQTRTLIVHWNGTAWKQQSSPNPGSAFNTLTGVAATSPTNAWAVGYYNNGASAPRQTLILHWNGTAWKQQSSPNPGTTNNNNALYGVAATSATNAWAVGYYINRATNEDQALIVRWNGTAWKQVPSPSVFTSDLRGVAATSATNAWAVGDTGSVGAFQALIERWNGTAWKQVPAPASSGTPVLDGVAATSASNAWAVGTNCGGCSGGGPPGTLTVHWNGTAWKQVASPSPGGSSDELKNVAATSATNAWAVGFISPPPILHWNGTAWKQQSSPIPGSVVGVAATSVTNAWAVGAYSKGGISHTLALHCC